MVRQDGPISDTALVHDSIDSDALWLGSWTGTRHVLVYVPVNTAPTLTSIPDQSTTSGTAVGPLSFTISDAEMAAGTGPGLGCGRSPR